MSSPFLEALATAAGAVADWYGEDFSFQARAGGLSGGRVLPTADPSRAPFTAKGVYATAPNVAGVSPVMEAEETGRKPGLATSRAVLTFETRLLAWIPGRGDLITRVSSGEVFEVLYPQPDEGVRTAFVVSRS